MARRKCKCQICKTEGWTDEFYRVKDGNRNLYYCNEDEYLDMLVDESNRKETLSFIVRYILPEQYRFVPPVMQKQLKEIADTYNWEVVLLTIMRDKDTLHYWMNRDGKFTNDFGRASYLSTIIKNNISSVYQKWLIQERREEETTDDIDIDSVDIDMLNDLTTTNKKKPENRGIMDFLE